MSYIDICCQLSDDAYKLQWDREPIRVDANSNHLSGDSRRFFDHQELLGTTGFVFWTVDFVVWTVESIVFSFFDLANQEVTGHKHETVSGFVSLLTIEIVTFSCCWASGIKLPVTSLAPPQGQKIESFQVLRLFINRFFYGFQLWNFFEVLGSFSKSFLWVVIVCSYSETVLRKNSEAFKLSMENLKLFIVLDSPINNMTRAHLNDTYIKSYIFCIFVSNSVVLWVMTRYFWRYNWLVVFK